MHSLISRAQLLKSLAIVMAGGLFAGMILLCLFFASELSRISNENQRLTAEKRLIDHRLHVIETNFAKINVYSDTLDELTLATVSGESDATDKGKDRIAEIRAALQRIRHYSSDGEARMNMVHRVDDMVADTGRLEQTLRNLVSILEHRREILDATPTLTPTTGWISSFFGERHSPFSGEEVVHRGIDIGAEPGTPVYAPAEGIVDIATRSPSFGKLVVLKHPYGIVTKYAHNSKLLVKKGQRVKRGQIIAEVGSTGRSTGPHLHYEVWVGKKPVDPRNFLLDQKLKVVNLATTDAIGGEEFAVPKRGDQPAIQHPAAEVNVARFALDAPVEGSELSLNKKIGIALLFSALGLLVYLLIIFVRNHQHQTHLHHHGFSNASFLKRQRIRGIGMLSGRTVFGPPLER